MGIDMSKMRAKRAALDNRGGAEWKPQKGEATIRIVPTPDGDPFKEYWFHYGLGRNPGFLSPKRNFGIEDPMNDFVRQLFDTGETNQAKDLMAKQRFYAPILVRGEEDRGVRIWGFGKNAYKQLLELVLNPDYGDITDVETGTDLVIKFTPGKETANGYPETTITPRRRSSPLCDDAVGGADKCAELLDSVPDFDQHFLPRKKTPQEIQVMLDEWLAGEDSAGDDVVKYDSNDTASSVDNAFKDLMSA